MVCMGVTIPSFFIPSVRKSREGVTPVVMATTAGQNFEQLFFSTVWHMFTMLMFSNSTVNCAIFQQLTFEYTRFSLIRGRMHSDSMLQGRT